MIQRICFIGNSITRAPNLPQWGWYGLWGMAAQAADGDFVHLTQLAVTAQQGSVAAIQIINGDVTGWPSDLAAQIAAFAPDLVIAQFGDNAGLGTADSLWQNIYADVRAGAGAARCIALGIWHTEPEGDNRDKQIRAAAALSGMEFLPIADMASDDTNANRDMYTDAGVRWHPGTSGHRCIARRLLGAIYGDDLLG